MRRRYTDVSVSIHEEQRRGQGLVNHHSHWLEAHLRQLPEERRMEDSLLDTPRPTSYQPRGNQWVQSSHPIDNTCEPTQCTATKTSKLCVIL